MSTTEHPHPLDPGSPVLVETWAELGVSVLRRCGPTSEHVVASPCEEPASGAWSWAVRVEGGRWWSTVQPPTESPLTDAEDATLREHLGPRATEAEALRDVACRLQAAPTLIATAAISVGRQA